MIGRVFGTVSQRVCSLYNQVSLMMKPQVVFVLGGPGAGKGTQCARIVEVSSERKDNEKQPSLKACSIIYTVFGGFQGACSFY